MARGEIIRNTDNGSNISLINIMNIFKEYKKMKKLSIKEMCDLTGLPDYVFLAMENDEDFCINCEGYLVIW